MVTDSAPGLYNVYMWNAKRPAAIVYVTIPSTRCDKLPTLGCLAQLCRCPRLHSFCRMLTVPAFSVNQLNEWYVGACCYRMHHGFSLMWSPCSGKTSFRPYMPLIETWNAVYICFVTLIGLSRLFFFKFRDLFCFLQSFLSNQIEVISLGLLLFYKNTAAHLLSFAVYRNSRCTITWTQLHCTVQLQVFD